jgi:hypothetical protein
MTNLHFGTVTVDDPASVRAKYIELSRDGSPEAHQAIQSILLMAIFEQLMEFREGKK